MRCINGGVQHRFDTVHRNIEIVIVGLVLVNGSLVDDIFGDFLDGSGVVGGLQILLVIRGGFVQLFVSHQHSLL